MLEAALYRMGANLCITGFTASTCAAGGTSGLCHALFTAANSERLILRPVRAPAKLKRVVIWK